VPESLIVDAPSAADLAVVFLVYSFDGCDSGCVVDETAIVIAVDQQHEFDVRAEASEITTNEGFS
jgi:hypothetical protein